MSVISAVSRDNACQIFTDTKFKVSGRRLPITLTSLEDYEEKDGVSMVKISDRKQISRWDND